MNVDGSVIPVVALVNVDVYAGARMVFFNDHGTAFFHYYGRRGCRCVGGSGGHWRRRLRTCGDAEGEMPASASPATSVKTNFFI